MLKQFILYKNKLINFLSIKINYFLYYTKLLHYIKLELDNFNLIYSLVEVMLIIIIIIIIIITIDQ